MGTIKRDGIIETLKGTVNDLQEQLCEVFDQMHTMNKDHCEELKEMYNYWYTLYIDAIKGNNE